MILVIKGGWWWLWLWLWLWLWVVMAGDGGFVGNGIVEIENKI